MKTGQIVTMARPTITLALRPLPPSRPRGETNHDELCRFPARFAAHHRLGWLRRAGRTLATCAVCRDLVSDLRYIAEQAKLLVPMHEPSPRVWDGIEEKLKVEGLVKPAQARRALAIILRLEASCVSPDSLHPLPRGRDLIAAIFLPRLRLRPRVQLSPLLLQSPSMPQHSPAPLLVLIGFMGAGKSTIGRLLALQLACPFIDLDDEIARTHGPIPDLFSSRGESGFRAIEHHHLDLILPGLPRPSVLALGGGAFLQPANRELLARHSATVIFLDAPFEVVRARIADSRSATALWPAISTVSASSSNTAVPPIFSPTTPSTPRATIPFNCWPLWFSLPIALASSPLLAINSSGELNMIRRTSIAALSSRSPFFRHRLVLSCSPRSALADSKPLPSPPPSSIRARSPSSRTASALPLRPSPSASTPTPASPRRELHVEAGQPANLDQSSELTLLPNGSLSRYEWKQLAPPHNSAIVEPKDQIPHHACVTDGKSAEQPFFLTPEPSSSTTISSPPAKSFSGATSPAPASRAPAEMAATSLAPAFPFSFPAAAPPPRSTSNSRDCDDTPLNGRPQHLRHFVMQTDGPEWHLWLDPNHKLLRISIPDNNTEILRQEK